MADADTSLTPSNLGRMLHRVFPGVERKRKLVNGKQVWGYPLKRVRRAASQTTEDVSLPAGWACVRSEDSERRYVLASPMSCNENFAQVCVGHGCGRIFFSLSRNCLYGQKLPKMELSEGSSAARLLFDFVCWSTLRRWPRKAKQRSDRALASWREGMGRCAVYEVSRFV